MFDGLSLLILVSHLKVQCHEPSDEATSTDLSSSLLVGKEFQFLILNETIHGTNGRNHKHGVMAGLRLSSPSLTLNFCLSNWICLPKVFLLGCKIKTQQVLGFGLHLLHLHRAGSALQGREVLTRTGSLLSFHMQSWTKQTNSLVASFRVLELKARP